MMFYELCSLTEQISSASLLYSAPELVSVQYSVLMFCLRSFVCVLFMIVIITVQVSLHEYSIALKFRLSRI